MITSPSRSTTRICIESVIVLIFKSFTVTYTPQHIKIFIVVAMSMVSRSISCKSLTTMIMSVSVVR